MKSFITILVLSFISGSSIAQQENKIIAGTIDSVYSKILKEPRRIWVSVPNSNNSLFAPSKYPVVYLLDGDAHFYSVKGMLEHLSNSGLSPDMIVVAITNTDRSRDLTPSKSMIGPDGKEMGFLATTGGGDQFLSFIKDELVPYIDSKYPTQPYRMLIGHSFGGLLAMHALVNQPALFNAYVSIDPSMWWDDQKLLKQAGTSFKNQQLNNRQLFFAVANTMSQGLDTLSVITDTSANNMHMRRNMETVRLLQKQKPSGLSWAWKYYGDDDHGTVPLIAEYDAMRFFFKDYALKTPQSPEDTAFFTPAYVTDHYKKVSQRMGYEVLPPEPMVNGFGYMMMQMGAMDKSESFFQMNIRNYPGSANVFDSMGDLYSATGKRDKAIENYKKALAIKENPESRRKLEDMLK